MKPYHYIIIFVLFIILLRLTLPWLTIPTYMLKEKVQISGLRPIERIVVSFSTIPSRVKYVPDVVKRLETQTIKPDAIYACIPHYSKRMKREYHVDFDARGFEVVRCEDYGPATKLLGCIDKENDPNTMIITIDDDQEYRPDMIERLVAHANVYPNCAIAYRTLSQELSGTVCHPFYNVSNPNAYYVEGFGGVLYRRSFITPQMNEYFKKNLSKECFLSDDLVISTWLEINGIPRMKLCGSDSRDTIEDINAHNPLNEESRKEVYNMCKREMEKLLTRYKCGNGLS